MKQLCLDHYGWLKLQTFQNLVTSPREHFKTDKKPKPFASMMGSPTPAVRVQCFDLKSEYDIKGPANMLLDQSYTNISQHMNEKNLCNTKMSLKESLDQMAQMKAVKASPCENFESPSKNMYALSSY